MSRLRFLVLLLIVAVAIPAAAAGRRTWRLGLRPPAEVLAKDGEARKVYADLAAERLRKRLTAAGIKEFVISIEDASTLRLETGVDADEAWMEALIASPGRAELRPVLANQPDWLELASQMPAGIEIRGGEETWVWSAKRWPLQDWLRRLALPDVAVKVFPSDAGYRSYTLGEPLASERDVRGVEVRQSAAGEAFATVTFDPAIAARLAGSSLSGVEQCGLVLDGEVIGFVPTETLKTENRVRLSAPQGAVPDQRRYREAWVQQVAGRLAAPLPVPIAVLKE